MFRVAIVGGTGYTGVEPFRLLASHPEARVVTVTSRGEAGRRVDDMFPSLRGIVDLEYCDPVSSPLQDCDLVFFATPDGIACTGPRRCSMAGPRSSIWRPTFASRTWTGGSSGTKCPTWRRSWWRKPSTGCPSSNRPAIREARLVANPGCYPTAVLLTAMRPKSCKG